MINGKRAFLLFCVQRIRTYILNGCIIIAAAAAIIVFVGVVTIGIEWCIVLTIVGVIIDTNWLVQSCCCL